MKKKQIIPFILAITFLIFIVIKITNHHKEQRIAQTINESLSIADYQKNIPAKNSSYGKYDCITPVFKGIGIAKLNGKSGLIDTLSLQEITPIKYDVVWSMKDGIAEVELNKKYGFVDSTGKELTALEYDFVVGFENGLSNVKKDDKWGYIDKRGEVVIPIKYQMAWSFKGNTGAVKLENKWGFINKLGAFVIPLQFDYVDRDFDPVLAEVTKDGKTFFINRKGKCVKNCP